MEIIFKDEKGKLFGSTKVLGIGKRQPKLIYGEVAKKLREKENIELNDLAKEFDVRPNVISKIEEQQMSLDEKMCKKYMDKFGVKKEDFFDLDLETLILNEQGHILKTFETSEECLKRFNEIKDGYADALEQNINAIIVDFSK